MKNTLLILALFFFHICCGQIDITISIPQTKQHGKEKMTIVIKNKTDKYYLLPFDKNGFKGYNNDELCNDLNDLNYPHFYFAPTLIFTQKNNKEPLESAIRSYHVQDMDIYLTNQIKESKIKYNQRLLKWKKKNHLKNHSDAIRNLYISNNLIKLSPKETLSYYIDFDIADIKRAESLFYDYYILNDKETYELSINLCIKNNIYDYLTTKQKLKLKKYNFFSGQITSNIISYTFIYDR